MSRSLFMTALGITIILFSKFLIIVWRNVISVTVPTIVSVTLMTSPILKGLKDIINNPPTRLDNASCEATPAIKAIIPAPPKAVCAMPFIEGKAIKQNSRPKKQMTNTARYLKNL